MWELEKNAVVKNQRTNLLSKILRKVMALTKFLREFV